MKQETLERTRYSEDQRRRLSNDRRACAASPPLRRRFWRAGSSAAARDVLLKVTRAGWSFRAPRAKPPARAKDPASARDTLLPDHQTQEKVLRAFWICIHHSRRTKRSHDRHQKGEEATSAFGYGAGFAFDLRFRRAFVSRRPSLLRRGFVSFGAATFSRGATRASWSFGEGKTRKDPARGRKKP